MSFLKSIGAVLAGLIVCQIVIIGVELLGTRIFPPPPGFDPTNPASLRAAVEQAPPGALALVLFGWALGTVVGTWIAARLAPRAPFRHATVVGILGMFAAAINVVSLPHPTWFQTAGPAVFPLATFLGGRLGARRAGQPPAPAAVPST